MKLFAYYDTSCGEFDLVVNYCGAPWTENDEREKGHRIGSLGYLAENLPWLILMEVSVQELFGDFAQA